MCSRMKRSYDDDDDDDAIELADITLKCVMYESKTVNKKSMLEEVFHYLKHSHGSLQVRFA
jgi:hypothetical protein